jgi:hypothetical protein
MSIADKPIFSAIDLLCVLNAKTQPLVPKDRIPDETAIFLHVVAEGADRRLVAEQYSRNSLLRDKEEAFEEGAEAAKKLLVRAKIESQSKAVDLAKWKAVLEFAHVFNQVTDRYVSGFADKHQNIKKEHRPIQLDEATKKWFEDQYLDYLKRIRGEVGFTPVPQKGFAAEAKKPAPAPRDLSGSISLFALQPGEKPPASIHPTTQSLVDTVTNNIADPIMRGLVRGYILERVPEGEVPEERIARLSTRAQGLLTGLPEAILKRYDPILKALGRHLNNNEVASVMENLVKSFQELPAVEVKPFLGMLLIHTLTALLSRKSGFPEDKRRVWKSALQFVSTSPLWADTTNVFVEAKEDGSFTPLLEKPEQLDPRRHVTISQAFMRIMGRLIK